MVFVFIALLVGLGGGLLTNKLLVSHFPATQQQRWSILSIVIFVVVCVGQFSVFSVKRVVLTVIDERIAMLESTVPVIPQNEPDFSIADNPDSLWGIAGALAGVLIRSAFELSRSQLGGVQPLDAVSSQQQALTVMRSSFANGMTVVQTVLLIILVAYVGYCIYVVKGRKVAYRF